MFYIDKKEDVTMSEVIKTMSELLTEEEKKIVIEEAKKLLASNEENFETDDDNEKINENPYATGVHDGIIDMLQHLGINVEEDMDEGWYN